MTDDTYAAAVAAMDRRIADANAARADAEAELDNLMALMRTTAALAGQAIVELDAARAEIRGLWAALAERSDHIAVLEAELEARA